MNTGARLGLAVVAGYVLGRFHKMRWALTVAGLAGRGRLPGGSGGLLQQGVKVLASSPEVAKLTDEMRGRLIDAGKAAAVAAVSSKLDSLSEGLRERTDAMQATSTAGRAGAARDRYEREPQRDERRRERYEEDRYRDKDRERYEDDRYQDEVPRPRRRPDEGDRDRGPAVRRSASRSESDRTRSSRQSPSSDDSAARSSARQGQDDRGSRPRSSASRTGGDSE
jgi:hypothetical protein